MSSTLKYSDFFELYDPLASRPLRISPREKDRVNKKNAFELFIGKLKLREAVLLEAFMGGQVTDVLWSGLIPLMCVSERIVNTLLDNKVTGWGTYPVEVYDRRGNYLPGYYGFSITSYAGEIDLSQSQIITKPLIPGSGKPIEFYKGLYFSEHQWDGSDIFRINYAVIIVNRRVQEIFKHEKIINVRFTLVPDIERPVAMFNLDKYMREIQR